MKKENAESDQENNKKKVLMCASVASMIDQFNMPNIRLMLEMGYEVHVACNFKEGNTCSSRRIRGLQKTLQDMHVIRHQWDCPRDLHPVKKCIRAYRQLLCLAEENQFAWMHCHSPVGGALARMTAHREGIPVIYTAHGFHFYRGAPLKNWLLYYPAEKLLARWTDVLVTVNKEDWRLAERRLGAGKVCYTPGVGIDVQKFAGKRPPEERKKLCRQLGIPENAKILLSVGELSVRKNHKAAITALAELHRKDVYYVICGQGEQKEMLMQHALRCGVKDRIRMPGFCPDPAGLYHSADIFVFPSLQEGMPAALMEAMAAGLPCVVSDIRGNRELVGTGSSDRQAGLLLRKAVREACSWGRTSVAEGGVRVSGNLPEQIRDALDLMLDNAGLREECGVRNQRKSRGFDRVAAEPVMKQIYAGMDGYAAGGTAGGAVPGRDAYK